MEYTLKLSTDFGVSYPHTMTGNCEALKRAALELEKGGEVRWVIVNESDELLYWCQYHEANICVPKDSVIATDDPYMKRLGERYGFKVISSLEMLLSMGVEEAEAKEMLARAEGMKPSTEAFNSLQRLVAEGIVTEITCDINEGKIGRELFGDGIKN